ncbi:MAG: right-handed parallel beta-helix repeat-containing protein [Clostridiales bacterium]|nr:right-handed parallel beta-helix repeat-containing protein [Clostridiales bacterium]
MNSHRQTKRALLTSVMALVMCVVMLLGTTFAWFTDTATANVNTIKSGNLHVEIQNTAGTAIDKLEWVKENGDVIANQDDILWEPGCTYLLTPFKIVNTGNLALKYKIEITGLDGSAKLLKVIKFTYKTEDGNTFDMTAEGRLAANGGATGMITVSAHMDELAGNEYQNETLTGVKFTVVATQDTVEYDSSKNTYDENATYPVVAKNQAEVNNAITNTAEKNVTIAVPAGQTTTLDNGIANEGSKSRNVTFIGDGSQTVDVVTKAVNAAEGNEMNYQRGSSFAFQNVTVQGGTTTYGGIVCNELTFENCTIKDKLTLYGKATFINCTFENNMADQYSIWTWGGTDVTFEGCTFNTNGKAILLYGGATASNPTNLVVNNCTFNDRNNGTAGKAAIEIGNDYNATYTLTVNNATVNGFAIHTNGTNTNSTLWANKNSMDAAHLTVTIDGVKIQ